MPHIVPAALNARSPIPPTRPITGTNGRPTRSTRAAWGGKNFRAGLEYRLGVVELRGAGRYSNGAWYPSVGAGYNITRTFGVDAAVYGTRTFLEPHPHVGLAISFRLDRR
jgi:hypothetical protein